MKDGDVIQGYKYAPEDICLAASDVINLECDLPDADVVEGDVNKTAPTTPFKSLPKSFNFNCRVTQLCIRGYEKTMRSGFIRKQKKGHSLVQMQ